ncbi:SGNH/GDSL hydrolase family protein [Frankia sp. AgPm24]|uniref:SGNH/GDSL hydrolase family protein n=1 Tax=Frankia sp. AgPm24 TaxID=631128 RepID=UPI0020109D4D|nr:SGNH/GDSL hydrolase family protein [Frankia sp. AgPm24]MCK9923959.1 SGNH/GDSL hydrolase family protein [Frankia sp. AgPm24]
MRPSTKARLLALGLAGALAAAGCSSGSNSDSPTPSAAPNTATPAASATPITGRYVAMGSSFAAGTGIGADISKGCLRSAKNYPHLLASRLHLHLVDVTCGGATVQNLLSTPQGDHPVQIAGLTADTRLVTITAGGNDLAYSVSTLICANAAGTGKPCTSLPTPEDTKTAAAKLRTSFAALFAAIKAKAPKARILLVTYPRVFPDQPKTCPGNVISTADSVTLAGIGATLQNTSRLAAADAHITFIDAYTASVGHDVCAPATDRWIDGSNATGTPYHPNATGTAALSTLIATALTQPSSQPTTPRATVSGG